MTTQQQTNDFLKRLAIFREKLIEAQGANLVGTPSLVESINQLIDTQQERWEKEQKPDPPNSDAGFSELIGIGEKIAPDLGQTAKPQPVTPYDDTVASERIFAVADLYYLFQHEKSGVFKVMEKLKEEFEAGRLRLSSGQGAFQLYRWDKRETLRYTRAERHAAYRRVLGYGNATPSAGARPNDEYHVLFSHFVNEVAIFFRDKRISEVIRERSNDPSFGSIATVRRAGLDLRNNLRSVSYGHLNVMRVELMQLLSEAFQILNADDVKRQFGADNAWDVVEEVLTRYYGQELETSTRQRMAESGRDILRWLGQDYILKSTRTQFEALLLEIGEDAEEWITSAQTLGIAKRRPDTTMRQRLPWSNNVASIA